MVRQRDSRASSSTLANGRASADQDRLNEAVAELRRLTQGQLFQALESLAAPSTCALHLSSRRLPAAAGSSSKN